MGNFINFNPDSVHALPVTEVQICLQHQHISHYIDVRVGWESSIMCDDAYMDQAAA
jgi:hypothetical protein